MKATGAPDGVCNIEIGDDGAPQGVSMFRVATTVKPSSLEIPVPPVNHGQTF